MESCNQFYSFNDGRVVPMTPDLKATIEDEIVKMANKALRTICIGYKEIDGGEGKL